MSTISVIVPIYKVEKYLHRCVESIRSQTLSDFELILVDDGSPDNCGTICDEYAEKDNRITVIHQKNGGLSAARNAGIEWVLVNSNSKWIAFVDSDDWIHPKYLDFLYRAVEKDKTKISVCNFVRESQYSESFSDAFFHSETVQGMKIFESNLNIQATVAWNKLYAKELFCELRYPNGRLHEDEFITYKLLYQAGKVSWIDIPLYFYYHNPNGIILSKWSVKRMDVYDAYEERIEYFKCKNQEYYEYELRRLFITYYSFFTDVMKQPRTESQFARQNTKARLKKSLRKYRGEIGKIATKYDMFSIFCLSYGNYNVQKWIVENDFEPIQNMIRRIKKGENG